ncbi:MAG: DUF3795 domain-containing protein [Planctomycetota bacterium]|jgi:hypothetical protein
MPEIIGYCGLNCCTCAIYLATREKDEEKRYKMRVDIAKQIKERYGQECKPEDVTDCDGCRSEGDGLFAGSKNCPIRKCARPKGIENCAHCSEYACDKLKEFFVKDPEAKTRLDVIRSTL